MSPDSKGKYPLYSSLSRNSTMKVKPKKHPVNKSMGDVGRGILKNTGRAASVLKQKHRFEDEEMANNEFNTVRHSHAYRNDQE